VSDSPRVERVLVVRFSEGREGFWVSDSPRVESVLVVRFSEGRDGFWVSDSSGSFRLFLYFFLAWFALLELYALELLVQLLI
jgi:hypothetical protein